MKKAVIALLIFALLIVLGVVAWNFVYKESPSQTSGQQADEPQTEAEDLIVGSGSEAKEGSRVTVRVKTFDREGNALSSFASEPFDFVVGYDLAVNNEIEYGIVGMKEGGKRRIVVPPEIVLNMEGYADVVAPGETLIFEIELLTAEDVDVDELY